MSAESLEKDKQFASECDRLLANPTWRIAFGDADENGLVVTKAETVADGETIVFQFKLNPNDSMYQTYFRALNNSMAQFLALPPYERQNHR